MLKKKKILVTKYISVVRHEKSLNTFVVILNIWLALKLIYNFMHSFEVNPWSISNILVEHIVQTYI